MKKTCNSEDIEMRDFLVQMHEYQMAQIPPKEVLEEKYRLSEIFYQKMDRLLGKQEKKVRFRRIRHGITAAAVVGIILFSVANPQYVAEAANRVIRWFADHVSYNFYEEKDIDIVPRYTLGYVPEGYELDADEYYEDGGIVSYIDNSENRITFLYGVTSSETNLDNEQKDYMILEGSNGETIHYLRAWDGEESSIMWVNQDKTIDYCIIGILSEEELLKVQKNIQIVEE